MTSKSVIGPPEGELWSFPKELSFLEESLDIGEQYHLYKWWEVIQ